jgi:hypothetical protein
MCEKQDLRNGAGPVPDRDLAEHANGGVTVVAAPDGDLDPDNDPDWRVQCTLRAPLTGPGYAGGAGATVRAYGGDASETTLSQLSSLATFPTAARSDSSAGAGPARARLAPGLRIRRSSTSR